MTRSYFAHPMVDYGTAREALTAAAIERHLRDRGHRPAEVINPNSPEHQAGYDALVAAGDPEPFGYWTELATSGHEVHFLCMPGRDRLIGSGVAKEVLSALAAGKDVWEVCRGTLRIERVTALQDERVMSIRDTKLVTHMMLAWRENR